MEDGRFLVRSFRVVFELERRIHRVDRWRIPVPHGIPLQALAYAAAALLLVLLLSGVPLAGHVLGSLAPPLRLVILPVTVAYLLTRLRADGRPAHAAALAWLRHATSPSRVSGFRASLRTGRVVRLGEVALVPDERWARYRRAVVVGPVQLVLRFPARAHARARGLRLERAAGGPMLRGRTLKLGAGRRLEVER
jgi:hypothetical protein